MTRVAIMQPYLFPYIGYWQLVHAVNTFVIYDDVQFIKQGYINRNYILYEGRPHRFTLELHGASSNKNINQVFIGNNASKILKTFRHAYAKAPFYSDVIDLIAEILMNKEKELSKYLGFSIFKISEYLNINTKIIFSSGISKNNELKLDFKAIEICKILDANKYINSIGGKKLYQHKIFNDRGISLKFLNTLKLSYNQFDYEFLPNLSIIDIMMFNSKDTISRYLNGYELID